MFATLLGTNSPQHNARFKPGPDLHDPTLRQGREAWTFLRVELERMILTSTSAPKLPNYDLAEFAAQSLTLARDTSKLNNAIALLPDGKAQKAQQIMPGLEPLALTMWFTALVFGPFVAQPWRNWLDDTKTLCAAGAQGVRMLELMGGKTYTMPSGEPHQQLRMFSQILGEEWELVRLAQPFQPEPELRLSKARIVHMAALGTALHVTPASHLHEHVGRYWRNQVIAVHNSLKRILGLFQPGILESLESPSTPSEEDWMF